MVPTSREIVGHSQSQISWTKKSKRQNESKRQQSQNEKLRHSKWFPHNGKLMDIANRSQSWAQDHDTNSGNCLL